MQGIVNKYEDEIESTQKQLKELKSKDENFNTKALFQHMNYLKNIAKLLRIVLGNVEVLALIMFLNEFNILMNKFDWFQLIFLILYASLMVYTYNESRELLKHQKQLDELQNKLFSGM